MSSRRNTARPPLAAPHGRGSRNRNQQAPPPNLPRANERLSILQAASSRQDRAAGRGNGNNNSNADVVQHRNGSIDTRRFAVEGNYTGRSTVEILRAVADQQGSDGDANNGMDLSSYSLGDVMKTLLNTNYSHLHPEYLRSDQITGIYNGIVKNTDAILDAAPQDYEGERELRLELEANLLPNERSKPGKYERVVKLVNVWMEMKKCDALLEAVEGRSTRLSAAMVCLREYVRTMQRFEEMATQQIEENATRAMTANYEKMPNGELERLWKSPGVELDAVQFPCCPNPKCRHTFIDGPPSNQDADEQNKLAVEAYIVKSREYSEWKKRDGPQPVDDETGEPLTKPPKNPDSIKKAIRCHCHQMKANPRTGSVCPVGCKYEGQTYPVGSCPICMCRCRLYIWQKNYLSMIIANSQPTASSNPDAREEANTYLNSHLNVNLLAQTEASRFYQKQKDQGTMAIGSNVTGHIRNHGYIAQAFNIVGNAPNPSSARFLREQINNTQHPAGITMTDVGDMRTLGRRIAADDRVRNNGLEGFVPEELSEEEQMKIAMMESQEPEFQGKTGGMSEEELIEIAKNESLAQNNSHGVIQLYAPPPRSSSAPPPESFAAASSVSGRASATPEVIARTRSAAFDRRAQTDKSNKKLRKNLSKVGRALSNPRNEAVVNLLKQYENEPTPDRLDECIEFMEELEE